VILADSNIWIDHFRAANQELLRLLASQDIVLHSCIVGELALGPLRDRQRTLADFAFLPYLREARASEVMAMIENHKLYNRGIGWTDAHLLASCLIVPGALLWTRDVRLGAIAESFSLRASLP
jgi:hypothetical protein